MSSSSADRSVGLFTRYAGNPILTPSRWPYTINAVMNAGAAQVGDQTLLLCRVEDRRGMSHLTVARSDDGFSNWVVDAEPLLAPEAGVVREQWGLEDARLTYSTELGAWAITFTSFGPGGPSLSLATTQDFVTVTRRGVVRPPEDKNGALLPRKVRGQHVLFHRPVTGHTNRADIWLSRSPDLETWSPPEPVMSAREGGFWDCARIGIGPPPLETPEGWLLVYHGVRQTVAGSLYRAGLALLDLDDPSRVVRRCAEWVLGPSATYEQTGDVPGVVFPCGLLHDVDQDRLRLYYGAADTCLAVATASYSEVLDFVLTHGEG